MSEEQRYIKSMLNKEFEDMHTEVLVPGGFVELFADMVVQSHSFLRRINGGEVSVVSLRDVARCIKLFGWFYTKLEEIRVASRSAARPPPPSLAPALFPILTVTCSSAAPGNFERPCTT